MISSFKIRIESQRPLGGAVKLDVDIIRCAHVTVIFVNAQFITVPVAFAR